jgi:hypothetical protein
MLLRTKRNFDDFDIYSAENHNFIDRRHSR